MAALHGLATSSLDENPFPEQRDLRSPSKAKNRHLKQKQKYYAYRAVDPSWVGQPYYTLVPVSEEPVTWKISKDKRKRFYVSAVLEHEHDLETVLSGLAGRPAWELAPILEAAITLAVSESKNKIKSHQTCQNASIERYTTDYDDVETIDAPDSLAPLHKMLAGLRLRIDDVTCPTLEAPLAVQNVHFKLKIAKWSKRDNYDNKEAFTFGPDRRHSVGRRKREKWSEKYTLASMQRKTKQRRFFGQNMTSGEVAGDDMETKANLSDTEEALEALDLAVTASTEQLDEETVPPSPTVTSTSSEYDECLNTPSSTVSSFADLSTLASLLASSDLIVLPHNRGDDDMNSFRTDDISDVGDWDAIAELDWEMGLD